MAIGAVQTSAYLLTTYRYIADVHCSSIRDGLVTTRRFYSRGITQQATLKNAILPHCSAVTLPISLVWGPTCSRVCLTVLLSHSFMLVRSGWSMPNHDLVRSVQLCCSDSRRSPAKAGYQHPGQACRQMSEMAFTFLGSLVGLGMSRCQALALLSCSVPDLGKDLQPVAAHTQLQAKLALS